MYPCHLTAVDRSVLVDLGKPVFDKDCDGSQDHDFWLRCSKLIQPSEIVHISKILYHWRKRKGSTADDMQAKPESAIAAIRALRKHFGPDADIYRGSFPGTYRVRKSILQPDWPDVYIIIPTHDNEAVLESCLLSLSGTEYQGRTFIHVIANRCSGPNIEKMETMRHLGLLTRLQRYDNEFSWSAINNAAVDFIFYAGKDGCPEMHKSAIVFLNDDVEALDPYWLDEMIRELWQDGVGVVGPKLLYPNMRIQHAGVFVGMSGIAGHGHRNLSDGSPGYFSRAHLTQQVSAVTGACMATKVEVFLGVSGFCETLPKAFNDVDYCLRAHKAGFKTIYTPWARLLHHEAFSRGRDSVDDPGFKKAIEYMETTWHCSTYRDPFFNPNLDSMREDFHPLE